MTKYTWTGVSGDWNVASDWTPAGGPPTNGDSATINGTATDTITVDTEDVAQTVTISDANATLDDGGTLIGVTLTMSDGTLNISPGGDGGVLQVIGALNLSGGALTVYSGGFLVLNGTLSQIGGALTLNGGAISGGTIDSTEGALTLDSGYLDGVTFDGSLNLTGNGAWVELYNGTTVVGSSGSGPGTINVTGVDDSLYFYDTQTVSNVTINLGDSDVLYENDSSGAGNQVLTLASSVTVDVVGNAYMESSYVSGDGIVSDGTIDVTGTGGDLMIWSNDFTNGGMIDVGAGDQMEIDYSAFTNFAAIANHGEIELGSSTVSSSGSSASLINAAGATVDGNGTVTATNLTNSGMIEASGGTLTLTDAVSGTGALQVDAGANLVVGGAIATGSIAAFNGANATLTLNQSLSFGATIAGLAESDAIDLIGITANKASVNASNQLIVTGNGTRVTLQLSKGSSGLSFITQPVSGGTDVICQSTSTSQLGTDTATAKALISNQVLNDPSLGVGVLYLNDDPALVASIAADVSLLTDSHYTIDTSTEKNPGYIWRDSKGFYDTGQCVALVLGLDNDLLPASEWGRGNNQVELTGGVDNPNLATTSVIGTPIATFGTDGDYNGHHAAIFLGYGSELGYGAGFFVLDQYIDQPPPAYGTNGSEPAEVRFITFAHGASSYYNVTNKT
jgi:hypothetical protein